MDSIIVNIESSDDGRQDGLTTLPAMEERGDGC